MVPFCVASYSGIVNQEKPFGTFVYLFPARGRWENALAVPRNAPHPPPPRTPTTTPHVSPSLHLLKLSRAGSAAEHLPHCLNMYRRDGSQLIIGVADSLLFLGTQVVLTAAAIVLRIASRHHCSTATLKPTAAVRQPGGPGGLQ